MIENEALLEQATCYFKSLAICDLPPAPNRLPLATSVSKRGSFCFEVFDARLMFQNSHAKILPAMCSHLIFRAWTKDLGCGRILVNCTIIHTKNCTTLCTCRDKSGTKVRVQHLHQDVHPNCSQTAAKTFACNGARHRCQAASCCINLSGASLHLEGAALIFILTQTQLK